MNVELMNNLMKNQFAPNYINKLKMKKMENATDKKKQPTKNSSTSRLLNLIVPIKPEEEMNNYEIFGELGKGAYGTVRMGLDKRTNEKIAIKTY